MRVVLDANVLFAAFVTRGTCSLVFEAVLAHHRLVVSEEIVADARRHLSRKVGAEDRDLAAFEAVIRAAAEFVEPLPLGAPVSRDPDDDRVLGVAIASAADVLVTGDGDLRVLRSFRGVPIVGPRGFLQEHAHRDPS